MVAEGAKVYVLGQQLCLQRFHWALIFCWTLAQCCERSLIRAESLRGQGPQRTWAAPSSARKIITSIRNAGSDKDPCLRMTGLNFSFTPSCWYEMAVYMDRELQPCKLCVHKCKATNCLQTPPAHSVWQCITEKACKTTLTHSHVHTPMLIL